MNPILCLVRSEEGNVEIPLTEAPDVGHATSTDRLLLTLLVPGLPGHILVSSPLPPALQTHMHPKKTHAFGLATKGGEMAPT